MLQIDPILFELADLQLYDPRQKLAFVPAGGDPAAAGGAPPGGDPAAGGMPMDPSMGGAPPTDPAAAGTTSGGPTAPPFDPSVLMPLIQQMVQQAMGGAGGAGGNPAAPGGGPVGVGAKLKIDPTMVYLKLGRLEKLMLHFFEKMGWPIPPDTLNDDAMIQAATGMPPQGGPASGATGGAAPAGPPGLPALPGTPAVNPIQPPDMGQPKTGTVREIFAGHDLSDGAAVLERLIG